MTRVASRSAVGEGDAEVPAFEPHPWLRNGHMQTIVGRYLAGPKLRAPTTHHVLDAGGGDRLSVHDSTPPDWSPGRPQALLVHGLAGSADSPYVVRVAAKLYRRGFRAVRMDLRGAGAGFGLAKSFYHAGRTEDVRTVAAWMASGAPGSPLALVGFSLGGNLVLKLAAEAADQPVAGLDSVVAANAPLDLSACCRHIQRPENRVYDFNFVRHLCSEVRRLHARFPELEPLSLPKRLGLYDFDSRYTAPRNGFRDAEHYYQSSSAGFFLSRISVPGLVVHAEDDPFIPVEAFRAFTFPEHLALELIPLGGHLGYVSRRAWQGDRRWLDARLTTWLLSRWSTDLTETPRASSRPQARTA